MKRRFLVGAAIAAMLPFFGVAETYTLAGDDAGNTSSMDGTGSKDAEPGGWTDSLGVTTKDHVPSAGNDYVVDRAFILRSPVGKSITFGGDSLIVSGDMQIKDKGANNSIVTIPSLIVAGAARIANGDGGTLNKIAGGINILEAGALMFDVSFDNPSGDARKFEVQSDVSGAGSLCVGASDDVKSAGSYVQFTGSLADFTGRIVVQGRGTVQFATTFASSLPGDPGAFIEDGLTVEGNSALKFETSGKLGITRGVSLDAGACEIFVAENETVQIDGQLVGPAGFKKTGKGTLALANVSPELLGTVTVAEGTLQLCDAKETALPAADVTVASGAVLDEHGPVVDHDPLVMATLTGVDVVADGQPHGPQLTVTEPATGYQAEWSVDSGAYVPTCPTFTEPGEHTVFCRVSAAGYMTRKLRTTVVIRTLWRIVATEAEKTGDWANATVAGDDAFAAIQGVIDASGEGDRILVKAGTYLLTNELSFASAELKGVTFRSDDGAGKLARQTTLLVGGYPATTNRLVRIAAPDVIVEGFTLTNGFVSGTCGGGAYLDNCGAGSGLRSCDILGCTAWHEAFVKSSINKSNLGTGGGVYVYSTGCVSNCLIRGNTAFAGGAVYLEGTKTRVACAPDDIPRVTASTLVGNQVVGYGTDNTFTGSALASYLTVLMDRCTIVSNFCNVTAKSQYTTAGSNSGYLYITDCVFESNHLGTWKKADCPVIGANYNNYIVCAGTTFVREGTVGNIFNNGYGSIVCDGNAMIDCQGSLGGGWKEYRNCLFSGNTNKLCLTGTIKAENCTFVNNLGAIFADGSSGAVGSRTNRIVNCLFAGNINDVYANSESYSTRIALFVSNCCIRASSLERRTGSKCKFGILVTNNCNIVYGDGDWADVSANVVRLVDPSRGDFRLREGSRLVGAGLTRGWMDGARDREGLPRVAGSAPDIGCYERQGYEVDPEPACVRAVATEEDRTGVWTNAIVGLKAAVEAAGDDMPVYVKAGTYDVTEPITVRNWGVRLVGEGPDATIVDGGSPERANRVLIADTRNVTLRNLTIRGGQNNGGLGGGLYASNIAIDFAMTNCVVDSCTALRGGGAYFDASFTVVDCTFTNCSTAASGSDRRGGGIYCGNDTAIRGVIDHCRFLSCAAVNNGSSCYLDAPCAFTDCLFARNGDTKPSWNCNGVIFSQKVQTVERCTFSANVIGNSIACVNLLGNSVVSDCVVEDYPNAGKTPTLFARSTGSDIVQVTGCVIRDTYADYVFSAGVNMDGCVFSNLTLRTSVENNVNGKVRNSLFSGCLEPIKVRGAVFENCSFVGNEGGVALNGKTYSPIFRNCVFWANGIPDKDYFGSMGLYVQKDDFGAANRVTMANCVLQANEETSPNAPDMRDADKTGATARLTAQAIAAGQGLLVAPGRGNAHPRAGSPVVDAGLVLDWMTEGATDLDGKPRVVGTAPDIGCYERQGDEIDPPIPCTRAVAKAEDKTGVWKDAIVGLKAAAEAAYPGEPLYVKAGTYDVTEPVSMKALGVRIVGEGPGTTIVDGGSPERANRIFTIDAPNVTLSGLTIRNGKVVNADGGGVYVNANGFAMTNCVVDNCSAKNGGGLYAAANCPCYDIVDNTFQNCWADAYGACAYFAENSKLVGCTFRDSTAYTEGGGFYVSKAFAVTDCVFTNCATSGNGGNQKGGAIYSSGDYISVIERCQFLGCAAKEDGSAFYLNSPCTITDCLFANSCDTHTAWNSGSVIFATKTQWIDSCIFRANVINGSLCAKILGGSVITNCVVENNPNVGKSPYLFTRQNGSVPVVVTDCVIRDTYANYVFDAGVNIEGCVFSNVTLKTSVDSNDRGNVRNCLFTGSPEPIKVQSPVFENCSFVGNVGGVVLYNNAYSPVFTNCVFWANSSPSDYYGNMGLAVTKDDFGAVNRVKMANCVLQANEETSPNAPDMREADKTGATALLTAEAVAAGLDLMAAPGRGNAHSRAGSPIVDAGLVLDWMTEGATDLDGKPRFVGAAPDVGCFERQGDEIDPPYPCTRAVAKAEDRTGVWADAVVGLPEAVEAAYMDEPLYVKAGTYGVAEPIALDPRLGRIRIIGEGAATVVDGGYPARTNRIFTIDATDVTLSGLTIRNGWLSGSNQNGGGIYVNANGFTITNCVIDTCGAYNGGGLYWINNKTVGGGVLDCVFTNCTASNNGGGLYIRPEDFVMRQTTLAGCAAKGSHGGGCFLETKDWVINDSVFTNCTAQSQGGGLRAGSGAVGAVTNTAFITCGGKSGGPALHTDAGITVCKCRVVDTRQLGGSLWGALQTAAPTLIDSCYFSRNQGYYGTAAKLPAGAVMTNCVFENQRRSVGYADRGVVTGSPRYTLRNCLFKDVESNSVVDENGDLENCTFTNIYLANMCGRDLNSFRNCLFTGSTNVIRTGNCKFDNCSFVSNFGGPALGASSHSPAFTNCIFWANTPTTSNNFRGNMGLLVQKNDFGATNRIAMANCVFQAAEETSKEAPNMYDADKTGASAELTALAIARGPRFVNPVHGNWRLKHNSPLRDKALTLDWMTADVMTDLDGHPRCLDMKGKPTASALPDIGCYECANPKPGIAIMVR